MKADRIFRQAVTLINCIVFLVILLEKFTANGFAGLAFWELLLSGVLVVLFYLLINLFIQDRRTRRVNINDEDIDLDTSDKMSALLQSDDIPAEMKKRLFSRVERSIEILSDQQIIDALWLQYKSCGEYERFYERIAWQIGSIFIPVSFTLTSLGISKINEFTGFMVWGGFALFLLWVMLFSRFRTSIRLYRDCVLLIEKMLGLFSASFVYEYFFEDYGYVIRVWPFLVALCGFYFNLALCFTL